MTDTSWTKTYLRHEDEDGYVPFNEDRRLGQNQYVCRYARGILDYPDLGQGLRWKNLESRGGSYHDIMIHKDDLETFHRRVRAYSDDAGMGQRKDLEHYLSL